MSNCTNNLFRFRQASISPRRGVSEEILAYLGKNRGKADFLQKMRWVRWKEGGPISERCVIIGTTSINELKKLHKRGEKMYFCIKEQMAENTKYR